MGSDCGGRVAEVVAGVLGSGRCCAWRDMDLAVIEMVYASRGLS